MRFFPSPLHAITSPVCIDAWPTIVIGSNSLVAATEHGPDGTRVFERVLEDKGHKITMKISILDEPRSQPTLSSRPQRGSQSEPYPEALPATEGALQPKLQPETRPDPRYEEIKHAAEEAVKIKSVRDRLGVSITYLEKLLKIGDVAKDVSRSLQIGTLADVKCRHRYTQLLEFP